MGARYAACKVPTTQTHSSPLERHAGTLNSPPMVTPQTFETGAEIATDAPPGA